MKAKKIYFIRHGKLDLPYKSHEEMPFSLLNDLGLGKQDPGIDKELFLDNLEKYLENISEQIDMIYCSPRRRCQDTSELIRKKLTDRFNNNLEIIKSDLITEVIFDLEKIYHDKEIDMQNINNAVFKAMLNAQGAEGFEECFKRVDEFFKQVNKTNNIVVVTHDFIMRVFEIYIRTGGKVPSDMGLNDLINTKRNTYFDGFCVDNEFRSIDYLF